MTTSEDQAKKDVYRYHEGSLIIRRDTDYHDVAKSIYSEFTKQRGRGVTQPTIDVTFLGPIACYQAWVGCQKAAENILQKYGAKLTWALKKVYTYSVKKGKDGWVYDEAIPRDVYIFSARYLSEG